MSVWLKGVGVCSAVDSWWRVTMERMNQKESGFQLLLSLLSSFLQPSTGVKSQKRLFTASCKKCLLGRGVPVMHQLLGRWWHNKACHHGHCPRKIGQFYWLIAGVHLLCSDKFVQRYTGSFSNQSEQCWSLQRYTGFFFQRIRAILITTVVC